MFIPTILIKIQISLRINFETFDINHLFTIFTLTKNKHSMFSISDIKAAHSKVKSGADFPAYIQEIKQLGVTGYDSFVTDGHVDYFGANGFTTSSDPKYTALHIAAEADNQLFIQYLKAHQQGSSDYPTFCSQSAETGIEKWHVDVNQMTCTYFDVKGNSILVEKIPGA